MPARGATGTLAAGAPCGVLWIVRTASHKVKINLANQVTLGRLVLAIVFFALLSLVAVERTEQNRALLAACFWVFLAAALGDVLDGLLARSLNQITSFGRIVDPVVDKVMVCGAFLFFASDHFFDPVSHANVTGVAAWMVVVLLIRELLVSAVRAQIESQGATFGAMWSGKVKMFVQCTAVCVILGRLAWFADVAWLVTLASGLVWATVVVTVISMWSYVQRAYGFLRAASAAAQ